MDLRDSYRGRVVELTLPIAGRLTLGVVDASQPGVAEGISRLLFRSIDDARSSGGGHLPDWLVTDIENNYISPHRVRTHWAPFGHRFCVMREQEIVGTVFIGASSEAILTIDRSRNNVRASDHPGFKPDGYHHMVNLSVLHEVRRALIGSAMIDAVMRDFRDLFDGVGIWVRGDPPWHAGLVGLGFVHDPSRDIYLPASVERTSRLSHAEFNRMHHCECGAPRAVEPTKKLQYVSFTRPFDSRRPTRKRARAIPLDPARPEETRDWGGIEHGSARGVARPRSIDELVTVMADAAAPVVIRGRGKSAAGQSLGEGIVIATERLDAIGEPRDGVVTVGGGVTWAALAARRLYPPVITGWPSASVGGTLSSGGFSKGSGEYGFQIDHVRSLVVVTADGRRVECSAKQAGWLFEAVLGGLGCFGVIAEATIAIGAELTLAVTRTSARPPLEADAWHVTSFFDRGHWTVVRAEPADTGATFSEYVSPQRDEIPAAPARWLHMLLPPNGLYAYLDSIRPLEDETLQVLAIRQFGIHRSLVQTIPGACAHAVLFGVTPSRETELRRLLALGMSLGGKNLLGGTLPRDDDEWRAHLGDSYDDLCAKKRTADPRGILGSSVLGVFGQRGAR